MKNTKLFLASILALVMLLPSGLSVFAQDEDKNAPSDVENVQATAGDSKITLSWDQATDAEGEVVGYKIYYGLESVKEDYGTYNLGTIETGDVLTYEVKDLENGVTYYFAVTAVDDSGNESLNYSAPEVSATPEEAENGGDLDDTEAPQVSSAAAVSNVQVEVVFSEAIVLPEEASEQAFYIENADVDPGEELSVIAAEMSVDDPDEATVLLTVSPQEADVNYILTVGIDIQDTAGNNIESGVADTASFKGISEDVEPVAPPEEPEEPSEPAAVLEIVSATALGNTQVNVIFSKEIDAGEHPEENFTVYEENNPAAIIEVQEASLQDDLKTVLLTTSEMESKVRYVVEAANITDSEGNEIGIDDESRAAFETPEVYVADLIPPEDITNLLAKIEGLVVKLTWTASVDSAKDLVDQILYKSENKGQTYDSGVSLGAEAVNYDVKDLTPGKEYLFKITTKDSAGNESAGVTIPVTLPETGAGVGAILIVSLIAGAVWSRRKR